MAPPHNDVEVWARNGSLQGSNIGAVDWSGKVITRTTILSDH